jgi:FkbM family methyltransferase
MFSRIFRDLKVIAVARNWIEIIGALHARKRIGRVVLRKGIVIEAPPDADLLYVFEEVFIKEVYRVYPIEGDVVDIGANVGMFAAWAVRDAVSIRAFEPFEPSADCFERSLGGFKNIKLHRTAVAGTAERRGIRTGANWLHNQLADGDEFETVTLDSITPCDLLKIDCEGSEYEILLNSSLNFRRIVAEFHEMGEQQNGHTLVDHLRHNGFRIDRFENAGNGTGFIAAERTTPLNKIHT